MDWTRKATIFQHSGHFVSYLIVKSLLDCLQNTLLRLRNHTVRLIGFGLRLLRLCPLDVLNVFPQFLLKMLILNSERVSQVGSDCVLSSVILVIEAKTSSAIDECIHFGFALLQFSELLFTYAAKVIIDRDFVNKLPDFHS